MTYNPDIHHRRSVRLKGYDYSRSGLYFITICIQDRLCLFGKIENKTMILNDSGKITQKWWHELENKYQGIKLHGHIAMPNHFHGIIEIRNITAQTDPISAGADLRVCPCQVRPDDGQTIKHGQTHRSAPTGYHISDKAEHTGPPLHAMVQWFKTMTTNEYIRGVKQSNWPRFNKILWQRNYYEHIIRSEKSYLQISEYILTNPLKWQEDKYYEPDNLRKHL